MNLSATVLNLVNAGYVVAMSDYQGLDPANSSSDQTYHPYLDATTAGYNLIDSVRAARKVVADTSDKWVSFGLSQGGQGAWAANELSGDYGSGTALIGSVSLAPPLDLEGFVDAAAGGTLTTEQVPAYQALLAALKTEHPDLDLDQYRRGIVADAWNALLQCDFSKADERANIIDRITPDDLTPASVKATDGLRDYLRRESLPSRPLSAPGLVIYGGQDTLIPPAWTDLALQRACGMGDVVRIDLQPDRGHSDLDLSPVLGWVADRFTDDPPPNSCPSFLSPPLPATSAQPEEPVEGGE
jgi:hypothetical protein